MLLVYRYLMTSSEMKSCFHLFLFTLSISLFLFLLQDINKKKLPLMAFSTFMIFCNHESESEVAQSCPTLSDPMDCSLPGSLVHEICQARVLEWAPLPSPFATITTV